jgi:hypothetical protein
MYSTPILDRRPRPPGSVPHRSIYNHANTDSPSSSTGSSETPLSRQMYQRRHDSSSVMEDEDEVSIELQRKDVVGLGISSSITSGRTSTISKNSAGHDIAQPSPPPPYGPVPLTSIHPISTPPTQDIDDDPLDNVQPSQMDEDEEETLRRERATDLAKSLGLALLSPSKLSVDESTEDGLDPEEIKKELKQMKRRLKIRDHGKSSLFEHLDQADELELVMAAQAADYLLKQHEELVSALPSHVRSLVPQLQDLSNREHGRIVDHPSSSTSSPVLDRIAHNHPSPINSPNSPGGKHLFRTVRNNDLSKPFPYHKHHKHARNIFNTPNRRTSFSETLQQESDERLIMLEKALTESRENEEIQRKLAARLKRDFEKLQRDFDHAELTMSTAEQAQQQRPQARSMDSTSSIESVTSSQFDSWAWKQTLNSDAGEGDIRVLRPKATKLKLRIKPRRTEIRDQPESDSAWGLTKFPEFPGEAGPSIGDRLTRLPPRPTFNRLKAKLRQPSPKRASPRHARVSSASEYDLPVPSPRRMPVSPSRSSRERRSRPGMSTETFRSGSPSTSRSRSRSANRTPRRRAGTPSRDQTPLRGRYDSISSQLASIRKFVSDSVRSVRISGSRSLGSELGSEYGDHDKSGIAATASKDGHDMWEDENPQSGSDGTDGPYCRPIPIPANASSGLSSLAIALAGSPTSKTPKPKTPRRTSPTRSVLDEFDPGSYRPKKGRRNWIRPLLLSQAQGLDTTRRPAMHPRTSSDGTLALAHRRQNQVRSEKEELYDLVQEISQNGIERRERQLELYSPPARLVNDLIILLSVLLEWIEMLIIIIYRVSVAVKYGRESIL